MISVEKLMIARKQNGMVNVVIQETYDKVDECHIIEDKRDMIKLMTTRREIRTETCDFFNEYQEVERTRDMHV